MTVLSNTTQLHSTGYPSDAGGTREDLSDFIYDLFPEDTWALSNFDREEASATYTEWLN